MQSGEGGYPRPFQPASKESEEEFMCCFDDAAVDFGRAAELAVRGRDLRALGIVAGEIVDAGHAHFLGDIVPLFQQRFRRRDLFGCFAVIGLMESESNRPDPNYEVEEMLRMYGLKPAGYTL